METFVLLCGFLIAFASDTGADVVIGNGLDTTMKVSPGNDVTFKCVVSGDDAFITWKLMDKDKELKGDDDTGEIKYSNDAQGSTHSLKLKDINVDYCGVYRCQGSKNYAEMNLKVTATISPGKCEKEQYIAKGSEGTIQCIVSGCPKPTVVWRKDDNGQFKDLTANGEYTIQDSGSLTILNAMPKHTGKYEMSYDWETQSDKRNVDLYVGVPPAINVSQSRDVYSYIGSETPVLLKCEATGDPVPDVKVTTLAGATISHYGTYKSKPGLYSVEVTTKKEADEYKFDTYKCNATNELGSVIQNIKLEKAVAPELKEEEEKASATKGAEQVFLVCELREGKPYPKFKWYLNDQELVDDDKYKTLNGYGEEGKLRISNPTDEDLGTYKCFGENMMGNVTGFRTLDSFEDPDAGARGYGIPTQSQSISFVALFFSLYLVILLS